MNYKNYEYLDAEEKKKFLKSLDIFEGLSDEEISLILPICRNIKFKEGEKIIEDKSLGDDLFIILEGEVAIELEAITPHFEITIARLSSGELLGEFAMIDSAPRSARAKCITPAECIVISGLKLREILDNDHKIGYIVMSNIAKILSDKIRKTNRRLLNFVRKKLF